MLCEKCKKNPATVFMTQIINGVKTEVHLCPECSIPMEIPISFENLFQGFINSIQSTTSSRKEPLPSAPCAACGMTVEQFKSSGKLGCSDCYATFKNEMEALLKNVQGSTKHEGKYPKRSGVEMRKKRETESLRAQLNKAVADENFEEAARLRDRIKALKEGVV